jgi:UDP-glucose 4-epimerase
MIASYCSMFGMSACVFRFGNVVGPAQTHGVGYDFVRSLLKDPRTLRILGDGTQSKPYIHVDDVIDAVLVADARCRAGFHVFNVATGDHTTVKEIADMAVECVVGTSSRTSYELTGGDRGWRGDVPVVRLNSERIRSLGWTNRLSSADAIRASITALVDQGRQGRLS